MKMKMADGMTEREALKSLANEVSGILGMPGLREAIGNTNVAVLKDRLENARAALAVTPADGVKASSRIERAKAIREEQQCSVREAVRLERAEFLTTEIQSAVNIKDLKMILLSIVNYRHSA